MKIARCDMLPGSAVSVFRGFCVVPWIQEGPGTCSRALGEVWLRRCAALPCPLGHSTIATVPGLSRVPAGSASPWAAAAASVILSAGGGNRIVDASEGVRAARDAAAGVFRFVMRRLLGASTVGAGLRRSAPLAGLPRPVYQPQTRFQGLTHSGVSGILILGLPLRCFQRLSLPNVANQPCRWRATSIPGSSTQASLVHGRASSGFHERRG